LLGTANLALCPTARLSKPRPTPPSGTAYLAPSHTLRHSKTRSTPNCQTQQTSPHATLSCTANFVLCPSVRHNKPRPTPHSQAQQTSHQVPMSNTANLAPRHTPTLRQCKARTTPHCQTTNLALCRTVSNNACIYSQDAVLWHGVAGMSCFALPCFLNAVWASTSGGFRTVSDTLVTHHSLVRAKGDVFVLLCFSVFFVRSTISRQPAGRFTPKFACWRTLVPDVSSPLLGVSGPRRAEKGANEMLLWKSMGNFCISMFFERYLNNACTDPHQILFV